MSADPATSVLIIGAGPTGLVLALWLTQIGIKVRLIDKALEAGTTSRALAVHARTLEFYRQLGIADEIVGLGFHFPNANLWVGHHIAGKVPIGKLGADQTPFPYVIIFPQDQHERLLIAQFKTRGVEIERGVELISFEENETQINANLKLPSGQIEIATARYLAGCDGARSIVRKTLDTGFEGSTYPDLFYVADIVGTGPALDGDLNVAMGTSDFLAIFPMKDQGHARLIGVVRNIKDGSTIRWNDVSPKLLKEMEINVEKINWFSTYHVHHRVASHFKKGRVFLAGDAGHVHSPVGGQGMNTGIGDAVNLAWKLGEVLHRRSSESLLETYEPERIAFAKSLVRTTDFAFQFISSEGFFSKLVRTVVAPMVLPVLLRFEFIKQFIFRTISQTGISYQNVDFNGGQAGSLKGGDRLPWLGSLDNFAPLKSLGWQVHIYGSLEIKIDLPVFYFNFNEEAKNKGFQRHMIYLIRPDGYIGLIAKSADSVVNRMKEMS